MNPVKIFTDSTSDMNKEDIEKYDIGVIPLNVVFKDRTYSDGVDIDTRELFKLVEANDELPKTAAVAPLTFVKHFKPWIDKGYDIYYVGISSKLSGTIQAAILAAQELPEGRVHISDSLNLSSAIGLQLLKAVKLRDQGLSAKEIAEQIQVVAEKVQCSFAVDTLEFLYKGGRCSGTKYFFGRMLHIHPIIKVVNGGMIVYKTPRGNIHKALNILIDDFKADLTAGNVDVDTVMITHSFADASCKYIYEKLSAIIDPKHIMITEAGCVISSHCGPNCVGILYIRK